MIQAHLPFTLEPDSPVKILAVDDDPQVLQLLVTAVESFGFECETAGDGVAALKKLQTGNYSLVITDLTMPRMDGMTLLRKAKNLYPRLDIIVVTGYAEKFSYTDVIKAGACDFIAKPFNIDELEAKLHRALREQNMVRKLEQLSMRDALTGLFNRRGFEVKLEEEVPRAHRQNYPLYVIIIDMDKFKTYNDEFGHQAGDRALQAIGRLLLRNTRDNVDWCCRPGGDEFAIIIPYTDDHQAMAVAQRILEQYRQHPFGETTLSIGLASFHRHPQYTMGEDIEHLLVRADQAMYRSKQAGGDRISCDPSFTTANCPLT
ncbi:GGDEF domain-containing response regulator [Desulfurivibrio alkaliphilus]|uniref:diguanylate cyclase n=1 Tax=Desulfurivibrio alkaliphilus (strain DSM 19089 / UNIQEM U267 / AHT2) TaxID=589865 RepID=D6Z3V8_DESAT|nr:diguanylate cyclase [Desulfurivibrio alkaliphilus]ADH86233.1 response regulator receiver modulated diguanylate cyclase [Desulfurivibrio alkaliphilus AHT 2]